MKAIHRKLTRDLWRLRGQALTIALVVACGIASYVAMLGTYRSLVAARDTYYDRSRFADLFAHVQRAPDDVLDRVRQVPGVATAEGRLLETARVEVAGFDEPVSGQFVSLQPASSLNALYLRSGRLPERDDEVVVSELFAKAHQLVPGDSLHALFEGRRTRLRIVGVGLSPEFVWIVPKMAWVSDNQRFGVFWMPRAGLETAYKMEGAFDDLVVKLGPGANPIAAIDAIDRLLTPYGSYGVNARDRQSSHRMINQELEQLETSATILPVVFLGVAAFLINVLLSRVIGIQREQIAALKAVGYRNGEVARHYLLMVSAILAVGIALGAALGAWTGRAFVGVYARNFRFPDLHFRFDLEVFETAVLISVASGVLGTMFAVRRAVRLAPAEAMRPESPPTFRKMISDRLGLSGLLAPTARMVVRDLERKPLRTALSALGIALATALLVGGNMGFDSIERVLWLQFERVQREDVEVTFTKTLPRGAALELRHIPGVLRVEPEHLVPVRMRSRQASREVPLIATGEPGGLRVWIDAAGDPLRFPAQGLAISRTLAERLQVRSGDEVEVEVLEGERPVRRLRVAATVTDTLGISAYLWTDQLARFLGHEEQVNGALLMVDAQQGDRVERALQRYPKVSSLSRRRWAAQRFRADTAQVFLTFQLVIAAFASVIAVGVVYNNARIALAVRSRDLATLRILGFTRAEIAAVLVGEQAVQLLLGIPVGIPLGKALGTWVFSTADPELYRFPILLSLKTVATAVVVIALAGLWSAVLVRRRADRLDLIAVLKARD